MAGNVWEWTCSAYDENYGGNEKKCATDNGTLHVLRGGSWYSGAGYARSAFRYIFTTDDRNYNFGFRLALGQTAS